MSRLIGKSFDSYTPESFYDFAKGLVKTSGNKSKEATGISITLKAGKTSLRMTRTDKTVTRTEVEKLASEYKLTELELLLMFKKRKVEITYELSDVRRNQDEESLKANAGSIKASRRKILAENKLQQSEHNSGMSAESTVSTPE